MKDHISNTKLEKRQSLLHPNTAQESSHHCQKRSSNKSTTETTNRVMNTMTKIICVFSFI